MEESTLGQGPPTRSLVKDCYRVRGTVIDVLPGGTRLIVFRDPSNIIRIMDFLHTIHVVSKRFVEETLKNFRGNSKTLVEETLKHLGFGLNIPGPPNHISLASLLYFTQFCIMPLPYFWQKSIKESFCPSQPVHYALWS